MVKVIRCDCGHVVRASSDGELVRLAQAHAKDVHDIELTAEQVLAMAEPADRPAAARP